MSGTSKGAHKTKEILLKKYGPDYFSKLGSHTKNRPNRNNPEHMSKLGKLGAQKRWGKKKDITLTDDPKWAKAIEEVNDYINKEMKGD